ncbi:MAG: hypothetical protein ABNG98_02350 [Flavobacterium sp.]|jgi:hypothetical protein
MKKNYFKLLVILLIFNFSFSQTNSSNCKFDYTIEFERCPESTINHDLYAIAKWDFSKIDLKNTEVSIEIQSFKDCFNGESASRFRSEYILPINDKVYKKKSSKTFEHIEMMSKCFKWRVVIKTDDCDYKSNWNFYSFL